MYGDGDVLTLLYSWATLFGSVVCSNSENEIQWFHRIVTIEIKHLGVITKLGFAVDEDRIAMDVCRQNQVIIF